MLINVVQRPKLLHQGQGGLFPHPGHTGDVVAGVPLQSFQVDELSRGQAIFLLYGGYIHHHRLGVTHLGGGQQNRHPFPHQLQAVSVTGGDVTHVPCLGGRQREGT